MICSTRCQAVMAHLTYQRLLMHRPELPKVISYLISEYVVLTAEEEEGLVEGFIQREWTRHTIETPNVSFLSRTLTLDLFQYAMLGVENAPSDSSAKFEVAIERVVKIFPQSITLLQDRALVPTPFSPLDAQRDFTQTLSLGNFNPFNTSGWAKTFIGLEETPQTTCIWESSDEVILVEAVRNNLSSLFNPKRSVGKAVITPFRIKNSTDNLVYCPLNVTAKGNLQLDEVQYSLHAEPAITSILVLPLPRTVVKSTGSSDAVVDWNFCFRVAKFKSTNARSRGINTYFDYTYHRTPKPNQTKK